MSATKSNMRSQHLLNAISRVFSNLHSHSLYALNKNVFSFLILFTFTLTLGSTLLASSSLAVSETVDTVTASVPVFCTLNSSNTDHFQEINPGNHVEDIGLTTLTAFCNDMEGFSIYAVGYSNEEIGNTDLIGDDTEETISTGVYTSGDTTSSWAMKLAAVSGTYTPIIVGTTADTEKTSSTPNFSTYVAIPDEYTRVAYRNSGTDSGTGASGSTLTTTYSAFISSVQPADIYDGMVKYTLVHPSNEAPVQPQPSTPGYINYYANAGTAEGTMGRQSASDGATVKLFASNFSRNGYGFAGWSDAYDYATNPNANFYGPNEDITVPAGTTEHGLALYAVWIKSAGTMQANGTTVCNGLTAATYNNEGDSDESTWSITASLNSISALTDTRDGQTYAIAKLTDDKCWMIENLRLADTHMEGNTAVPTTLTVENTNNPLNDGDLTNPTVTLKHNYSDSITYTNLSPTSNVAYNASTAPEGWCKSGEIDCIDQSRLRTDNTANRITFATTSTDMSSYNANFYSYGNYYNWYSATAGRGAYGIGNGVAASGDICPYGWHLPTGRGFGDFGLLSNSLGGYKNASNDAQQMIPTTSPTGSIMLKRLRHFPNNLVYSGNINGASFSGRGDSGMLWSSAASSGTYSYDLYFGSSVVDPRGDDARYRGASVRCIATPSS